MPEVMPAKIADASLRQSSRPELAPVPTAENEIVGSVGNAVVSRPLSWRMPQSLRPVQDVDKLRRQPHLEFWFALLADDGVAALPEDVLPFEAECRRAPGAGSNGPFNGKDEVCLLYTSDAADEL